MVQTSADDVLEGVAKNIFPRMLYKYRDFGDLTRTLEIIKTAQLYFSTPSHFNDPLDCNLSWDNQFGWTDIKALMVKHSFEDPQIESALKQIAKDSPELIRNMRDESINTAVHSKGLLSLAKHYDKILMWSHYCKNHSGIVFGFDITEDPEFFSIPMNVEYTKEYNPLLFSGDLIKALISNFSLKHLDWSYEEEVRIYKETFGLYNFKKSSLKEIFFGCKTEQSNIDLVKKECLAHGYNVIFKKAKIAFGRFELEFEDC